VRIEGSLEVLRALALVLSSCALAAYGQTVAQTKIVNAAGLQLLVADRDSPKLRIVLPGQASTEGVGDILFPEHVTAVKTGATDAQRLYLSSANNNSDVPHWRQLRNSIEYERELREGVQFLARARLEEDGVRFHYEFTNRSAVAFSMISAVTDPRLTSILHDVRLERTYVHHPDGFDLLASETPERLTMPLDRWLPARYLVSYAWPVPRERIEHRGDGITYYNKSRPVDFPFLATVSTDGAWVVASFTNQVGNLWTNPDLTCQHVDPQTALTRGQHAVIEMKILVMRGSIQQAFQHALNQRASLR